MSDVPPIDFPDRPATRGEVATMISRLVVRLDDKILKAIPELKAQVLKEIFQDTLVPLDLRTEALYHLVQGLLLGDIAPGSCTPEQLGALLDQVHDAYKKDFEEKMAKASAPAKPAEEAPL